MKKMLITIGIFIVVVIAASILVLIVGGGEESAEVKIGGIVFKVEVASSVMEQGRGLSGRQKLGDDEGMLFIFSNPGLYSFWMKGMNFPIDIIWINDDRIIGIERNVPVPVSVADNLKTYVPRFAVNKALEINAGLAEKYGFKIGQQIEIVRQ